MSGIRHPAGAFAASAGDAGPSSIRLWSGLVRSVSLPLWQLLAGAMAICLLAVAPAWLYARTIARGAAVLQQQAETDLATAGRLVQESAARRQEALKIRGDAESLSKLAALLPVVDLRAEGMIPADRQHHATEDRYIREAMAVVDGNSLKVSLQVENNLGPAWRPDFRCDIYNQYGVRIGSHAESWYTPIWTGEREFINFGVYVRAEDGDFEHAAFSPPAYSTPVSFRLVHKDGSSVKWIPPQPPAADAAPADDAPPTDAAAKTNAAPAAATAIAVDESGAQVAPRDSDAPVDEAELARQREGYIRTWRSADGKFTVEAAYLFRSAGNVALWTRDRKRVFVPLEKLSPDDQQHARESKPPPNIFPY